MSRWLRAVTHYAPLVLVGLTFGALAMWSSQDPPRITASSGFTQLTPPLALPTFLLDSPGDETISAESLKGHWTLLTLGFTSCPDICPATLSRLASAIHDPAIADLDAKVLFVSVDPERDSLDRLDAYTRHFGPSIQGATGSHAALGELTGPLGLFYQAEESDELDSVYSVQHSTTVLVIAPSAHVFALLRSDSMTANQIAESLRRLAKELT